jgi:hypothetical protein
VVLVEGRVPATEDRQVSQVLQAMVMARKVECEDPNFLAWESAEELRQIALDDEEPATMRSSEVAS